jgi:chaperonin GroES
MDMAANVGDSVVYGKYDGSELRYNDVNHQMIKGDDILFKYSGTEMKLDLINCVKDQVLIRLPPKEEAASSGIILSTPGDKEKKPDHGTVVKIGPGRQAGNGKYMSIQVEPNDKVKFRSFAGNEIKIQGIDYIVVRSYDILAKWK